MAARRVVFRRVPSTLPLDILILYIEAEIGEGTVDDKDPETKLSPDYRSASICLIDAAAHGKALKLNLCVKKRPLLVEKWSIGWADKKTEKWITSIGGSPAHGHKVSSTDQIPFLDFPDDPEPEAVPVMPTRPRPTTAKHKESLEVRVPQEKLDFVYKLVINDRTITMVSNIDKDEKSCLIIISASRGHKEELAEARDRVFDIITKVVTKPFPQYTAAGVALLMSVENFELASLAFRNSAVDGSLTQKSGQLLVIAKTQEDLNKAVKIYETKFKQARFEVSEEFQNMVKTDRWNQYFVSIASTMKVAMTEELGNRIVIEGVADKVEQAKSSLLEWLKNNSSKAAQVQLLKPIWKLLRDRSRDFIDDLKDNGLKKHDFKAHGGNHYLQVEGSQSFIQKVAKQLGNQGKDVCHVGTIEVVEEGLDIELFLKDPGKSKLQQLEIDRKCVIEVTGGGIVASMDDTWDTEYEDHHLSLHAQVAPKSRRVKRSKRPPPQNLKIETGELIKATSKVLVCTIPMGTKSLEKAGILGKIFSQNGGDVLQQAFKKLYDDNRGRIPFGDAHLIDQVGDLSCSYVIFIMVKQFRKNNISQIEKVMKSLIWKCLEACKSAGQHSVAFPTMGSGNLRFPQGNLARCFSETVSIWSQKNSGFAIDVRVVAHEDALRDKYIAVIMNDSDESSDAGEDESVTPMITSSRTERTKAPTARIEITIYSLDRGGLNATQKDVDVVCKNLLTKKVLTNKSVQLMSDQDKQRIKSKVAGISGLRVNIENNNILLLGTDDAVKSAEAIVKDVLEEIDKRLQDPDVIRQREGDLPYLQALFRQNLPVPKHWNLRSKKSTIEKALEQGTEPIIHNVSPTLRRAIENLITATWKPSLVGKGSDAVGLNHSALQIIDIQQIENPRLYKQYGSFLQQRCLDVGQQRSRCVDVKAIDNNEDVHTVTNGTKELDVLRNPLVNEFFMFHGSTNSAVQGICKQGLDTRLFSDGLFGKGAYFAESSTKADQYSDRSGRHGGDHYMFLCRVVMMDPFVCSAHYKFQRPPCRGAGCNNDRCPNGHDFHDSVLGIKSAVGNPRLLFREFVVYDKYQCYPEFLIKYQRV